MIAKQVHPVAAIAPPTVLSEPVLHPRHEEIEREVVTYLVNTWEWPSERHKKGFISWKLSEVINFMFPTGDFERVKLACELLLLGFLMDDWFDKHSFEENTVVVDRLLALLANPSTFRPATTIERMHTTLFNRILNVKSKSCAEGEVLDMYMRMLACHCDATRGDAATLRDYLVFREVDVGMPICMAILYWTEDIVLTPSETALLEPLEHVANYHVSILNDIFSFEREWSAAQNLGEGAVLVNGVRILADETAVSVGMAKRLCFALVRAWEVEFKNMAEDLMAREGMKGNQSMRRMVEGIERRMTGAEAFSWRTSRYL